MSPTAHDNPILHSGKRKAIDTHHIPFLIDGLEPIEPQSRLNIVKNKAQSKPSIYDDTTPKRMVVELIDLYYPPLICPDCIHVSRAKLEAEDHLKTKHQGMKLFQCLAPQCQHNYKSKGGLKYHLEHAHQVSSRHSPIKSDIPVQEQKEKPQKRLKRLELSPRLTQLLNDAYSPTTCPACHVEFKKKTHVIHHLVEAHQGQEPYQCIVKECKRTKAYATREGLIYHLMNYHDQ